MARGLLLWVSCICALLHYGSSASIKKKEYRYSSDALNLDEDDYDDDKLMAERSDPEPTNPSFNQAGGPVNGMVRLWKQEDLNKPLTFPVSNQAGQSSWSASTYSIAEPPSNQDSAYASQSGSRVSQSSTHSRGMRNDDGLVYEQVFQYPKGSDPSQGYGGFFSTGSGSGQAIASQESSRSYASTQEMPSFHYQTNAAAYPSGMEDPSFGPTGYYQKFILPQKAVSWGVSDPAVPPAPPPSYITQSTNSYQRMRYSRAHTKYSPDPYAPMPVSQNMKDPRPQWTDPGVAKEPQSTKW